MLTLVSSFRIVLSCKFQVAGSSLNHQKSHRAAMIIQRGNLNIAQRDNA